MATKQTRQPRPPRKAAAPLAEATPAPVDAQKVEAPKAEVSVVAPVEQTPVADTVAEQTPTVEAAVSTQPNADAPHPNKHTGRRIGDIPSARIRRHMDKLNINSLLDEQLKLLKRDILAFKNASNILETKNVNFTSNSDVNGKKKLVHETRPATEAELADAKSTVERLQPSMSDLESKSAALTRGRTRFSDEAPVALSVVCEEMVLSLTRHGMDRVLKNKKKIIQLVHLYEEGITELPLYALYRDLPSFVRNSEKLAKAAQEANAKAHDLALLTQAERDFKKTHSIKAKAKGKNLNAENILATPSAVAETAQTPETDEEPDEVHDSKTSFKHYIQQIFKGLQESNVDYKDLRMSHGVKAYLSDLVVEFIRKLSGPLVLIATSMKNKTVSEIVVMRAVHLFMTDGHAPVKSIAFKEEKVRDPAFVKAEAVKQEEAKKAGTAYTKPDVSSIPLVDVFVASQVTLYPTSGYDELNNVVQEKLKLYSSLSEEAKKALNEEAVVAQ